ncbi:hypothetical protein [Thalassobacillus hwangdonensis]|uniref:4Fe-4S ferredoxin-type domain-containing protein n=1 Tax=Thalassobacillus hwangdonensis TaxID=546108 RepID=A0ABW3L0M0_9BACI
MDRKQRMKEESFEKDEEAYKEKEVLDGCAGCSAYGCLPFAFILMRILIL